MTHINAAVLQQRFHRSASTGHFPSVSKDPPVVPFRHYLFVYFFASSSDPSFDISQLSLEMRRSFSPLLPHSSHLHNIARDKQTLPPWPGLQTSPATNKPFPPTMVTNIARDKQTLPPDQDYNIARDKQTLPLWPGLQTSPATKKPFPLTRITNIARDKLTLPPFQDYSHRPRQTNPSPRPGLQTSPVTNKPFPLTRVTK